jgi:hypothetical protein
MVDFPNESGPTRNQRGSLRQVNATLLSQNELLVDARSRIETTNDILRQSLEEQSQALSLQRLREQEELRERGKPPAQKPGGAILGSLGRGVSGAGRGIDGMFRTIAGLLTPAALAALPAILGRTLLTRGVPALAITAFADEISDFLLGPTATQDLRDQVAKALTFGAAGSIFGKKFALIGATAGFLINDEVQTQLLELGKSISAMLGEDVSSIQDLKDLAMNIGNWIRENLVEGLQGLNMILDGNFMGLYDEGKITETFTTLGILGAVLFGPGRTLRAAMALPGIALWTGGKVFTAIKAIAGLGTSITAATATTAATSAAGAAGAASRPILSVARGLMFGPAGAIISVAALGAAVSSAFMQTDLYRSLKRQNDEFAKEFGLEGITASDMGGEAAAELIPDPVINTNSDEQNQALRQTYLNQMAYYEPGSLQHNAAKDALAKLEASMVDPGLQRAMTTSSSQMLTETANDNSKKGGPTIADFSDNSVVNNTSVANTQAIVAPVPSPAERDPYSGLLGAR